MKRLKVSENKRFLAYEDDTPFFYLGDTTWELFRALNKEEAEQLIKNRKERKFNVLQAVALAEFDGLRNPNAYGQVPLQRNEMGVFDPTLPDVTTEYNYWSHVDYVFDLAEKVEMYIGLLPTWGDKYNLKWGKGPEIFNEENAYLYGKWIGERYRDQVNLIWILGGDRPLENDNHKKIIHAMAKGIKEGDQGTHLVTFHPSGGSSSSDFVHEADWLDFHMIQSGHSFNITNYKMVEKDYHLTPTRPTFDGEPRYEDHPKNFNPENGYFNDIDTRQAAYWAVFAGAFGHTYGHHSIWSMMREKSDYYPVIWKDALTRPGASQLQYLYHLILSRPFFERIPDQSLLIDAKAGFNHLQATRGEDYAFIYTPNGVPFDVNMGKITGETVKTYWYSPRDGRVHRMSEVSNTGVIKFTPPTSGPGEDWILVLDDSSKAFLEPGQHQ